MSRAATADVIEIRPTNNIYTILVIVAFIAELIAFIALYSKAGDIFESTKGLFG